MHRVLIDVTHPMQVHFFKHLIRKLEERGDRVLISAREKDVTLELLTALGFEHRCLSRSGRGAMGMAVELARRYRGTLVLARELRPHVMLSQTGVFVGPVGALLGVPRLVQDDTEHAGLQRLLGLPFATRIFTGTGYQRDLGRRQVRFRGVPAQAYLDPAYFQPSPEPLRRAGVDPDQPYTVVRTVSWQAMHDRGLAGASEEALRRVVERLETFGRVLLSSEGDPPRSLEGHLSPVPASQIHHLLARARLYLGEGGTMAAEAAVLGTPTVLCNPLRTGYLEALEQRYRLLVHTQSLEEGVKAAEGLLRDPESAAAWGRRRERLLEEGEDIPAFMLDLVDRAIEERWAGERGRRGNR